MVSFFQIPISLNSLLSSSSNSFKNPFQPLNLEMSGPFSWFFPPIQTLESSKQCHYTIQTTQIAFYTVSSKKQ